MVVTCQGYVIPGSVVRFFLRGVARSRELQLCALGVRLQPARSPALRSLHGLDQHQGALLIDVAPLSAAAQAAVRPGDVLLAVDGVPVAEDGTVAFRDAERIGPHGRARVHGRTEVRLPRVAAGGGRLLQPAPCNQP